MTSPFILITSHRVQDGQLETLEELGRAFVDSIDANEPDVLSFKLYLSEDGRQLSHLLVQRDAAAMDRHFQISGELIGKSLEVAETTDITVLGEPGPILSGVLAANAAEGVNVRVLPRQLNGLVRIAA